MDALEQLVALPGSLTVGARTYPVLPPTPGDMLREALQMKQLARAACRKDPLKYVLEGCAALDPATRAVAVAEAVKLGSAPAPEPDKAFVEEQYGLPDGVRWRLWYHVNRSGGKLSEEEAKRLVTDFNSGRICMALDEALKLPEVGDPKDEPAPPSGTSG